MLWSRNYRTDRGGMVRRPIVIPHLFYISTWLCMFVCLSLIFLDSAMYVKERKLSDLY